MIPVPIPNPTAKAPIINPAGTANGAAAGAISGTIGASGATIGASGGNAGNAGGLTKLTILLTPPGIVIGLLGGGVNGMAGKFAGNAPINLVSLHGGC